MSLIGPTIHENDGSSSFLSSRTRTMLLRVCIRQQLGRRRRWILTCALFVVGAMSEIVCLHAQAPARIRLATLAPKGSSYYQILQTMGEKWRQAPGGGASLTIFADGSMGGEADMVRRMRVGQLQAGM